MMTRPNPRPPIDGITIHAIGDTHVGPVSSNEPWRLDAVARDVAKLPAPHGRVQLGDGCNNNPATSDMALLNHFLGRLGGPTTYRVMGNHDINADVITPAQWATLSGYSAPNYVVDLPGLRLVMLSPSAQWTGFEVAPPAALTWLDGAIGGTSNPVIVCCHYPLYRTHWGSETIPWYLRTAAVPGSSQPILDVLAAHQNVRAWLSGHLHSPITDPGLVTSVDLGAGHRIAAINTSCIWYTLGSPYPLDARDTINTLYVTLLDDRVEVRFRDHGAGVWAAPNGNQVRTVHL